MRKHDSEYEEENPDEFDINAHNHRITFSCFGFNGPWIYLFEVGENGNPCDDNNADRLLDFFQEIGDANTETGEGTPSYFRGLDEDLIEAGVLDHFENGHYQSAIRDAFNVLEERVRESGEYGPEIHGTNLMHQAFNVGSGPLSTGSTNSEKEGFLKLYAGAFQALRNPASHRTVELDWQRAHDIIHLVNLLLSSLPEEANDE